MTNGAIPSNTDKQSNGYPITGGSICRVVVPLYVVSIGVPVTEEMPGKKLRNAKKPHITVTARIPKIQSRLAMSKEDSLDTFLDNSCIFCEEDDFGS